MTRKINIAIDGYSSCGKGTLAKALAKKLSYIFIDSGAMYRAVTLYLIQNQIDISNEEEVISCLDRIELTFKQSDLIDRFEIYLNGINVESEIRELSVASKVSEVAKISAVRRKLVEMQQKIGAEKGVVMDGRDIGTVVFPNAELKIFMTASTEVRAQRRYKEMLAAGKDVQFEEVQQNLIDRDRIDSSRDDSPLTMNNTYHELDNSNLSQEEQFNLAMSWVSELLD
jgi:cytidylate kinase